MYLDEVDKHVDVVLLYNGLLNKIKDKIGELKNENYQIALDSEVAFDTGIMKNNLKIQVLEELLQQEDKKC